MCPTLPRHGPRLFQPVPLQTQFAQYPRTLFSQAPRATGGSGVRARVSGSRKDTAETTQRTPAVRATAQPHGPVQIVVICGVSGCGKRCKGVGP